MLRRFRGVLGTPKAVCGRHPIAFEPLLLDPDLGLFHGELRKLFGYTLDRFFGVLNRMPQSGRDIQSGKHFRPRRLDVGLEPLDAPVLVPVIGFDAGQLGGRALLVFQSLRCGALPLGQQKPARLAACFQCGKLCADLIGAQPERRNLLAVGLNLLLTTGDVQLACMNRLAGACRGAPRLRRAKCAHG